MLAFYYHDLVAARVAAKVPVDQIDDVVNEILISAMKSSFDGKSLGEFHNWLRTITRRRIADLTEKNKRKKEKESGLPSERDEDGGHPPDEQGVEGGQEVVELNALVDSCLAAVPEAHHRRVIELYGPTAMGFFGVSARETADMVNAEFEPNPKPMTEANVHKIYQRFKDSLRDAMGGDPQ